MVDSSLLTLLRYATEWLTPPVPSVILVNWTFGPLIEPRTVAYSRDDNLLPNVFGFLVLPDSKPLAETLGINE
jgi:hypothetical protein